MIAQAPSLAVQNLAVAEEPSSPTQLNLPLMVDGHVQEEVEGVVGQLAEASYSASQEVLGPEQTVQVAKQQVANIGRQDPTSELACRLDSEERTQAVVAVAGAAAAVVEVSWDLVHQASTP